MIKKNRLLLIEDDLYGWLRAEEGGDMISLHDLIGCRSFYIASLTKCLCPGLRIAYGAVTDDIKDVMKEGFSNISIKTSSLDAEIMTELLLSGSAQKLLHQKAALAKKASALFDTLFPDLPPQPPSYFRWLPIPTDAPLTRWKKISSGRASTFTIPAVLWLQTTKKAVFSVYPCAPPEIQPVFAKG